MTGLWWKLFVTGLNDEIDRAIDTMTSGACADYAAYSKEVGKIEAFRRVADLATEVNDKIAKGD